MRRFINALTFALVLFSLSGAFAIASTSLVTGFGVRQRAPLHGAAAVPAKLVLTSASGRVTIATNPFRYSVSDASGRNVLVSFATQTTPAPAAYVIASELPDVPAGTQAKTPVYSALTYTVGTSLVTAQPGGPFQADLVAASQAGVTYEATSVLSETHGSSSANLVLATSEALERHVLLSIAAAPGGFRFVATFDHSENVAGTAAAFVSRQGEAFHGFGGRHNALDQAGQTVTNYVEQENQNPANVAGAPAATSTDYLFPNGPEAAYYVQPQFISSGGYGFCLNRPELSEFRLGVDSANAWLLNLFGATLDYTVTIGSPADVIAAQTSVTGRQLLPPDWAFYSEIDRNYPIAESSAAAYYANVESDLTYLAMKKIPVTSYRIEGWSSMTAAQLKATIATLHSLGIHALLYVNPYGGYPLVPLTVEQAISAGYETRTPAGTPYVFLTTDAPSTTLDFTNPATVRYWNGLIAQMLDTGADGFMEDFAEQVMPDMQFANGATGLTMHNEDPVLYHEVTRAAVNAYLAKHPGRDFFSYARSGYTGSAGYEYSNFPGDETTDFGPASGLASLAPDMLSRAVGGAYGYTTDIGGYFNFTGNTSKELFLRWAAWSALTPFFRLHNDGITGTEMPWNIDADTVTKYAALAKLHNRFVPVFKRLWQQALTTGMPITRPLWLADPGDAAGAKQQQEWLLGPDILVAPVVASGVTTNSVYLPAGCWIEQNTMRRYDGRRTITVPSPLGTLNYFFHCNTHPA